MPEMHLRQLRFTYSACVPVTKNKKCIQKFRETVDSIYIYQNELGEACFQDEMAYEDFKDLPWRKVSDNILNDEAVTTAKNPKYVKEVMLHWFTNFLIKCLLRLHGQRPYLCFRWFC